jgi:phage protein U
MPDVIVAAPAPVMTPPPLTKARLVAEDGRAVALSWAPQATNRDGSAAAWSTIARTGRKPMTVMTGQGLETMSFSALMGNKDLQQSIEVELEALKAFARDGTRLQFSYGGLEAGWWRIDSMSITSQTRSEVLREVTRASVDITLVEDVPPTVTYGSLTRLVWPTTPPPTPSPTPGGTMTGTVSIDLRNWKWTSPYGPSEHPTEVGPPVPTSFQKSPYFTRNRDGSINLLAPCQGTSTGGSNYVRAEFREMRGSSKAEWDSRSGTNTLIFTTKVTRLPKVKSATRCTCPSPAARARERIWYSSIRTIGSAWIGTPARSLPSPRASPSPM